MEVFILTVLKHENNPVTADLQSAVPGYKGLCSEKTKGKVPYLYGIGVKTDGLESP